MPIPNAEHAIIDPAKLYGYLLSHVHPQGRAKAVFFRALGYESTTWPRLDADLRRQHLSQEPASITPSAYGQMYVIRAMLVGPSAESAAVVSIWIVRTGEHVPRFVTAYPEGA